MEVKYFDFWAKFQIGKRKVTIAVYDHIYMPCLEQVFDAKCCNYRCELLTDSKNQSNLSVIDKEGCDSCPSFLRKKCYND